MTHGDLDELNVYSKSQCMEIVKAEMGSGCVECLNDYRHTMAERLLKTTDASVLEIAAMSGFDNLSYFNRIFKRKYGQSPGKWRGQELPG